MSSILTLITVTHKTVSLDLMTYPMLPRKDSTVNNNKVFMHGTIHLVHFYWSRVTVKFGDRLNVRFSLKIHHLMGNILLDKTMPMGRVFEHYPFTVTGNPDWNDCVKRRF